MLASSPCSKNYAIGTFRVYLLRIATNDMNMIEVFALAEADRTITTALAMA